MALLGDAAVAMWWDMAAVHRPEFEDWHSHEHLPERLGIPGFLRGSRWAAADGGEGFFVMYELDTYLSLTSPHYLARLNAPTPWSVQMMPRHRHMVRSQCRVVQTLGAGVGQALLTMRLSPAPGQGPALQSYLAPLLDALPTRPGLAAAHLLCTQTPQAEATAEQKIRGGDGVADWIVLVGGYDLQALEQLCAGDLAPARLEQAGAMPGAVSALYRLSLAMTPADLRHRSRTTDAPH